MKCLPNFDEETIKEAGSDFLSQQRTYSSSIVTDLFTITSVSTINCNVCDQKKLHFKIRCFHISKLN